MLQVQLLPIGVVRSIKVQVQLFASVELPAETLLKKIPLI